MKYIHNKNIIHRDLRLENLYLNEKMDLKLSNFELSLNLENNKEREHIWSITTEDVNKYIAPELIENTEDYSYEVDIWSLWIIIYKLIIGKNRF